MKQKMINKVQLWNDTSTCTSQPYEKQTQTTFLGRKGTVTVNRQYLKILQTAFRDKIKVKLPSYVAQNIATEQNTRLIFQRVQIT